MVYDGFGGFLWVSGGYLVIQWEEIVGIVPQL